eukprot:44304_1
MSTSPLQIISLYLNGFQCETYNGVNVLHSSELIGSGMNVNLLINMSFIQAKTKLFFHSSYLTYHQQTIGYNELIRFNCDAVMACILMLMLVNIVISIVASVLVYALVFLAIWHVIDHCIHKPIQIEKQLNIFQKTRCHVTECRYCNNYQELKRLRIALNKFYNTDEAINIVQVLDDHLYLLHEKQNCFSEQCTITDCKIFRRNFRHTTKENIDCSNKHIEDLVKLQIMDKIHCHHLHQYNLSDDLIGNRQYFSKYNQLILMNDNQIDSVIYSSGYVFEYEIDHSYSSRVPNEYYVRHIDPRYSSLKQELLNNDFRTINMSQFEYEFTKSEIHLNSQYRKRRYAEIGIEHILSIMIYCNYDELQYEFTKTYRLLHEAESKSDLIQRHSRFYHLGRTLMQTVKKFGINTNQPLYHGIRNQLIFPCPMICIYGPLSTTSLYCVATKFTQNTGLLIEFGLNADANFSGKCFSCEWLSDYAAEKEYLFIQNTSAICVVNIVDMQDALEFKPVLQCMRSIENA